MNSRTVKGAVLVALGAISYGILTTIVKMAYAKGFRPQEVTFSQFLIGFALLTLLDLLSNRTKENKTGKKRSPRAIFRLMLAGSTIGFTSISYYLSVRYVSVSIGIVLLMQSVWIGVLLDSIISKRFPSAIKIIAVLVILAGTLLGTNFFAIGFNVDWRGIIYGLISGVSFALAIYSTNRVGLDFPAIARSRWMIGGGLMAVTCFALPTLLTDFDFRVYMKWGPLLACFGAIIPPFLFNSGMPRISLGLGSILSSLELPVAVIAAYLLINEKVSTQQWIGVVLILSAVVLMNVQTERIKADS